MSKAGHSADAREERQGGVYLLWVLFKHGALVQTTVFTGMALLAPLLLIGPLRGRWSDPEPLDPARLLQMERELRGSNLTFPVALVGLAGHAVAAGACWLLVSFPDMRSTLFAAGVQLVLVVGALHWLEKLKHKYLLMNARLGESASTPSGERKAFQLVADEIRASTAESRLQADTAVLCTAIAEEQRLLEARDQLARNLSAIPLIIGVITVLVDPSFGTGAMLFALGLSLFLVLLVDYYTSLGVCGAIRGKLFERTREEIQDEIARLGHQMVEIREYHETRARERLEQRFDG